jgi:hypothetical protein
VFSFIGMLRLARAVLAVQDQPRGPSVRRFDSDNDMDTRGSLSNAHRSQKELARIFQRFQASCALVDLTSAKIICRNVASALAGRTAGNEALAPAGDVRPAGRNGFTFINF